MGCIGSQILANLVLKPVLEETDQHQHPAEYEEAQDAAEGIELHHIDGEDVH